MIPQPAPDKLSTDVVAPFKWGRALAIVIGTFIGTAIFISLTVMAGFLAAGGDVEAIMLSQLIGFVLGGFLGGWIASRLAQRNPLLHVAAAMAPLLVFSLVDALKGATSVHLVNAGALVVASGCGALLGSVMRARAPR